jgi:hypothetical protein
LEGGKYSEVTQKETQRKQGGGRAGLRTPIVELGADVSRKTSGQREWTLSQTPESEFNRLYDALREQGLQTVETVDDKDFAMRLAGAAIVEFVPVTIARTGLSRVATFFDAYREFLPMEELLGSQKAENPAAGAAALKFFQGLGGPDAPVPFIAKVRGAANLVIAGELRPEYVSSEPAGEIAILAKIRRALKPGQREAVGTSLNELTSMGNRETRGKLLRDLSKDTGSMNQSVIRYPALVVLPIAIYR